MTDLRFALIAHGELFLSGPEGELQPLESDYVESYRKRVQTIHRKQAWKQQGAGARFGGGGMLWGDDFELDAVPVSVTGLSLGPDPGTLVYSISTGLVGGVFMYDLRTQEERRLFHSADYRVEQIHGIDHHRLLACTLRRKDGTTCLAVMRADGSEVQEVTDGDVIDLSPRWLPEQALKEPSHRHQLVYQSAGVGRDKEGRFVAVGPAGVVLLDPEHGESQVLLERDDRDYIAPLLDSDRTVYCITRPYQASEPSLFRTLVDGCLLPFRLLAAVFGFLNLFTLRHTGKPLMTGGSARQRSADLRQQLMMGNMQHAAAAAAQAADQGADDAVRDWSLIALSESGQKESTLASGVRTFDILPSGELLVSDGSSVDVVSKAGKRRQLAKKAGITRVVAIS